MPNSNLMLISILLDGSGSMQSIKPSVISGFNEFINDHKNLPINVIVSLSQFSADYVNYVPSPVLKKIYHFRNVREMPALTDYNYMPAGGTPLIEAMTEAMDNLGRDLAAIHESERPGKVAFVVITDGQENSSNGTIYSKVALKARIKHQQEKYNWQMVYLGANHDSFAEAGGYGVVATATMNYAATAAGTMDMFKTLSNSSVNYARGATQGLVINPTTTITVENNDTSNSKV